MIKALLFDFGQTLVDSSDAFRVAEKEAQGRLFADMSPDTEGLSWKEFLGQYRAIRKEFHQKSNSKSPFLPS